MFEFFKKINESPVNQENGGGNEEIVNVDYAKKTENFIGNYTSLLDENKIEWTKEEVEEAKNKFELVKDQLPEEFFSKTYEERKEFLDSLK